MNADKAPTTPTMIAIGCELLLKPLKKSASFE